jgi:hypothetical protein
VARALLQAAQAGPADVKTLAIRAQVGFAVARYTSSRLVARGQLTAERGVRPSLLRLADNDAPAPEVEAARFLYDWIRSQRS